MSAVAAQSCNCYQVFKTTTLRSEKFDRAYGVRFVCLHFPKRGADENFRSQSCGVFFFSPPPLFFLFFFPPSFLFFFSPGVSGVQSRLAPLPEATTLRGGLQLHNTRTADTDSQNTARLLQALTERSRQDSGPPSPLPPLLSTATAGHHHHRRLLLNVVFISVSLCLSVSGLFV